MKKIIILCVCCFCFGEGFGQARLGIIGGLNLSKYSFDYKLTESPTSDFLIGFHAGLISEFSLSEKIALTSVVLYSQKGFAGNVPSDLKFRVNYIEIPVSIKYSFSEKFYGFVGPYLAIGISGEKTFSAAGDDFSSKIDFVNKEVAFSRVWLGADVIERIDYGLNFGVGYEINNEFNIRLSYSHGLNNTNVDLYSDNNPFIPFSESVDSDNAIALNQVISLSLVYFFF